MTVVSILFAAVLLDLPQASTLAPPRADIVVVGERLRRLKLETKTDRRSGLTRCVFKRRSGDPAFDTMMCDAILGCAKTVTTRPQMERCIGPQVEDYVRKVVAGGKAAESHVSQ